MSSSYARGNENSAYPADGVYYLGPCVSPGYAITNFQARYHLTRRLQFAVQIRQFVRPPLLHTAAQLANTALTGQGIVQSQPFPANADGNYPACRAESG